MKFDTLNLRRFYPQLSAESGHPILKAYCRDVSREIDPERKFPVMLICPGGAYSFVSDREAEPIALNYLAAGFNAFVLTYSVAPARYPSALLQAAAAVDFIRKNAVKYHVDPDKISICGFSAGGHLAGSLACFWNEAFLAETLNTASENLKPNAAVLGYPVITGGEKAHRGSFDNLCGDDAALVKKMSLETAVTKDTPPIFLWHTADDGGVPVENSLLMASALREKQIPFELHIFAEGSHGLSTCGYQSAGPNSPHMINPEAAKWFELSIAFLKKQLDLKL
ncbi:MAG TPA: alpha/beta hydrolase [Oscillospiraceae bacterium]|nr:alpha/beta hydrolase [Oscillospiraceae bacterium]HPF55216.1 alpha/beta hydrolase [Clostridiales bacterium]HPK36038.1 alpha/beta hydrolase [Oscillospiraceae bacterium]HPR75969.1 alpha/beta hydrolase [Oscillospiraceae bacterium]